MGRAGPIAVVVAILASLAMAAALLVTGVVTAIGGNLCAPPAAPGSDSGTSGNGSEPNPSLNQAIMAVSNNGQNNRLAAAMWIGTHLESNWRSRAIGAGSYGPFQIQNPRDVPPVVHPSITSEQAMDPPQATNYMLPAYLAALRRLDRTNPGLWLTDPERAAERTAYYAERPKYDYYVNRGSATVNRAWRDTVALMQSLGVSTDFSRGSEGSTPLVIAAGNTSTTVCTPGTIPGGPAGRPGIVSGDAVTLARRVLELPAGRVQYIYNSRADIEATAAGRLVTPGSAYRSGNTPACASRRPVPVSAELLQVILDITQRYSITLGSTISSHHCNSGRHPMGRAVDINSVNGVNIGGGEDSFSQQHMALYNEFRAFVASVLPRGSFINGQPVGMGGLGQQQCVRPARPEQPGLNEFPDGCSHLHIDVGTAATSGVSP